MYIFTYLGSTRQIEAESPARVQGAQHKLHHRHLQHEVHGHEVHSRRLSQEGDHSSSFLSTPTAVLTARIPVAFSARFRLLFVGPPASLSAFLVVFLKGKACFLVGRRAHATRLRRVALTQTQGGSLLAPRLAGSRVRSWCSMMRVLYRSRCGVGGWSAQPQHLGCKYTYVDTNGEKGCACTSC